MGQSLKHAVQDLTLPFRKGSWACRLRTLCRLNQRLHGTLIARLAFLPTRYHLDPLSRTFEPGSEVDDPASDLVTR